MDEKKLRRYSRVVVDGVEQAPSRAMLRAVGFEEKDFSRPQIGIASTWSMITPCNMHINDLAQVAAKGADDAGGAFGPQRQVRLSALEGEHLLLDDVGYLANRAGKQIGLLEQGRADFAIAAVSGQAGGG